MWLKKTVQEINRWSLRMSKERFAFVPLLPMNQRLTDEKLYGHFGLTKDEIDLIEAMVRPMEPNGNEDDEDKE